MSQDKFFYFTSVRTNKPHDGLLCTKSQQFLSTVEKQKHSHYFNERRMLVIRIQSLACSYYSKLMHHQLLTVSKQNKSLKNECKGWGDTQLLRACTALPEDLSSVPRPQVRELTAASEVPKPFFWLAWILHSHPCTHTNKK